MTLAVLEDGLGVMLKTQRRTSYKRGKSISWRSKTFVTSTIYIAHIPELQQYVNNSIFIPVNLLNIIDASFQWQRNFEKRTHFLYEPIYR